MLRTIKYRTFGYKQKIALSFFSVRSRKGKWYVEQIRWAIERSAWSCINGPINWRPIGNPLLDNRTGKLSAGRPENEWKINKIIKITTIHHHPYPYDREWQ